MPIQPKQQAPYYTPNETIRIYTAILSQTGTDNPIPEIIINTIGDITWTRTDVGKYSATLTNAFPINKTIILDSSGTQSGWFFNPYRISDNQIDLDVTQAPEDLADGWTAYSISIITKKI